MEFRQHGVEMPSTLKFLPESLHFGMQVLEIFWMSAIYHRLINPFPQWIPVQRLTHAGSRLTCAGSQLTRVGSRLLPEEVDDQLKLLFAIWTQFSSILEKVGSVILESFRHRVVLVIINKIFHVILHVGKQVLENLWLSFSIHRVLNPFPQWIPVQRLTHAGSRLTHAGSRLTHAGSRLSRVGSRLLPQEVVDHLKRFFAIWIGHHISSWKK